MRSDNVLLYLIIIIENDFLSIFTKIIVQTALSAQIIYILDAVWKMLCL